MVHSSYLLRHLARLLTVTKRILQNSKDDKKNEHFYSFQCIDFIDIL